MGSEYLILLLNVFHGYGREVYNIILRARQAWDLFESQSYTATPAYQGMFMKRNEPFDIHGFKYLASPCLSTTRRLEISDDVGIGISITIRGTG